MTYVNLIQEIYQYISAEFRFYSMLPWAHMNDVPFCIYSYILTVRTNKQEKEEMASFFLN